MDREFLKDHIREKVDFSQTDQKKGVPMPPVQKSVPENAELIDLPDRKTWILRLTSLKLYLIENRDALLPTKL